MSCTYLLPLHACARLGWQVRQLQACRLCCLLCWCALEGAGAAAVLNVILTANKAAALGASCCPV